MQLRRSRLRLQKINHIFISHLHGDHYFGLIGLITSFHLLGREKELNIYAHKDLEKIIQQQLKSSQTVLRYPLKFNHIDPGKCKVILDDRFVNVSTIPMNHDFPTCGFLIREKAGKPNIKKDFIEGKNLSNEDFRSIKDGKDYRDEEGNLFKNEDITTPPQPPRSYAYCSDTAYYEEIIPVVKDVDLLYHEATFTEDRAADAEAKYHSTAKQAARIAKKANARKLVLGHFSARYKDLEPLLLEAKEVFPETILAYDGLIIEL